MAYRIYTRKLDEEKELATVSQSLTSALLNMCIIQNRAGASTAVYMVNSFGTVAGFDVWKEYKDALHNAYKKGLIDSEEWFDINNDRVFYGFSNARKFAKESQNV